jgi:hypothetical protein
MQRKSFLLFVWEHTQQGVSTSHPAVVQRCSYNLHDFRNYTVLASFIFYKQVRWIYKLSNNKHMYCVTLQVWHRLVHNTPHWLACNVYFPDVFFATWPTALALVSAHFLRKSCRQITQIYLFWISEVSIHSPWINLTPHQDSYPYLDE